MRERIRLFSIPEDIALLAEGNLGALNVLMQIYKKKLEICIPFMLNLDDMNIRGPQIWIGYKDFAKENLDTFINAVNARSEEMINIINFSYKKETAVPYGASKQ